MALIKCKSSPLTNNNLMPIHLTVVITVFLVLSGCAVCGWHWPIVTSTGSGGYGAVAMIHQQACALDI